MEIKNQQKPTSSYHPNSVPGTLPGAYELNSDKDDKLTKISIQSKLTIGQPDDKYEQGANQVADQMIRTPDSIKEKSALTIENKINSSKKSEALSSKRNSHFLLSKKAISIQRAVRESPQPSFKRGAQVCLVHLHGNERNALQAAQSMYNSRCANLVYLNNTGRCIDTGLPGCSADPNRIFSTDDVTESNAFSGACPCPGPQRNNAVIALREFRDQILAPAISRCRGGSGTGLSGPLPVVAFHNNTPGGFSIRSYNRGGYEARATEVDTARTGGATNPSQTGRNPDNFLLVTQPQDFTAFQGSHNVVLQSGAPNDDGSLSVALAGERYVNIEAQGKRYLGPTDTQFITNKNMADDVLDQLGVSPTCPQTPTRQQPTQQSQNTTPLNWLNRIIEIILQLIREIIRVLNQVGTMPAPLPRTAPPRGLPSNCLTFGSQANLDAAKSRWAGVIASMALPDVVNWITGMSRPPANVTTESRRQRDCLLRAIRIAASRRSSGISLPRGRLSRSGYRSFSSQRDIWRRKFHFLRFLPTRRGTRRLGSFGHITNQARQICGSLINPAETEWNPHNSRHRVCWNVSPIPGTTPPAIPSGARALTVDERQNEILQTSSAPGLSRHHWGTDFDLFDPNMDPAQWRVGGSFADEYSWMMRNASTYGFIQAFTPTSTFMSMGYVEERWHWSYYPIAQALLEFTRSHQTHIEQALLRRWGSSPQYSFIQRNWRNYMFNVNERGRF